MSVATEQFVTRLPRGAIGAARLRVALIGCGAIAEQMHLPVVAGHEGVELAALVDRDEGRVRRIADAYGVAAACRELKELPAGIGAAILATPPFHHAPGAIELMRRGMHVLVEKPMALSLGEAEEMCRVAEERGVVLAVGLYKRLLPVTRLLASMMQRQQWGRALSFSYEWGGIGGYKSATLGLMKKEYAGGGVLMDLGAHAFDQLVAIFGDAGRVMTYKDDARGGIEADCVAEVVFTCCGDEVRGVVELSRVRNLANRLEIKCERASLFVALNERFEVTVIPASGEPGEGEAIVVRGAGPTDVPWFESYRAQIDDWLTAIRTGEEPVLSGRSVLPSVRMIEECYRVRQPLSVRWLDEMPESSLARRVGGIAVERGRVLVTGAGGFIGSRVAEILSLRDGYAVRAMVRSAGSAARVARLPVELVQGDLKSDADVRRAIEGCDAVVHCAVGTAYGQPREIEAVTVGGTRRVAGAARAAGVRRLVHLSSIGVHDAAFAGVLDGDTPVQPARGDWYGTTKAAAEAAVWAEERRGLSVAVLRPGCVYGPFGFTFVINPLRALAEGRLVLEDAFDSPANTVFVDNLVEAIACSLAASDESVRGRAFAIGDGDEATWGEYFGWFAERLGSRVETRQHRLNGYGTSRKGGWLAGVRETVLSAEAKSFAKRVLASDPLGTAPRWVLQRFPAVETRLRSIAGMNAPQVYRHANGHAASEPVVFTSRAGRISISDSRERIGFSPTVTREAAQQLTWDWARHARIV